MKKATYIRWMSPGDLVYSDEDDMTIFTVLGTTEYRESHLNTLRPDLKYFSILVFDPMNMIIDRRTVFGIEKDSSWKKVK